ncbi:pyridoxal phosphate-dependent decarboxylase family protein [Lentzea albida]|uniref:Glutamate or tyrosine decarboxylase n=1 Tax=Lentzea albida TaxID=65499 RepID=A0A1H9WS28_9PSEU|nr:aminotransferase class I/II-fold pyridoxal phosphate-dependent enzyme [Lentzea albida]SES36477.1 Glutamate or tyrosine decarboxylase [Lentzea albida]
MDLLKWMIRAHEENTKWQNSFSSFSPHPSMEVGDEAFAAVFHDFTKRLEKNYPFFHPSYAGHMVRPPHFAATIGYLATMLVNPNNHAFDGGPATVEMEREVVAQLSAMFGFDTSLGHLTTSGTIANLEALYVARELRPGQGVAFSEEAHFTHSRMCRVLGVEGHEVRADRHGRMDVEALEELLRTRQIGTVVLTAGTTGLGAVDPIHDVLALRERYDIRIHVDAAYGGFFTLLQGSGTAEALPPEPWQAISRCDSVVVDPHKHGLQPYGCGAVLFNDPAVDRFYDHDSPYTYCAPAEFNPGETSLECSRSGAAAAALWLTFQVLPPTPSGLGQVLGAGRRAALDWATRIRSSEALELYQEPELDIVTYFPAVRPASMRLVDETSARMLESGARDADPVFLSTLKVRSDALVSRHPGVTADAPEARIIRSVLMKPEFEDFVPRLHDRLEALAFSQTTFR